MSDWKLVPTYPTQAMDDAGERAVCDSHDSGPSMVAFRAYVAMVEAAPEAPSRVVPLYAAAPDLLAALERIASPQLSPSHGDPVVLRDIARAAIAAKEST